MPVIVVANPEVGVGKSTVATHLAGALAIAARVLLPPGLFEIKATRAFGQELRARRALEPVA
jgi:hypothetical protein